MFHHVGSTTGFGFDMTPRGWMADPLAGVLTGGYNSSTKMLIYAWEHGHFWMVGVESTKGNSERTPAHDSSAYYFRTQQNFDENGLLISEDYDIVFRDGIVGQVYFQEQDVTFDNYVRTGNISVQVGSGVSLRQILASTPSALISIDAKQNIDGTRLSDVIVLNDVFGSKGSGDLGNDTLRGGKSDNALIGGGGRDTLQGRGGDDTLNALNDTGEHLIADQLDGGAGDDEFFVDAGDRIANLEDNDKLIAFITDKVPGRVLISNTGKATLITAFDAGYATSESITIEKSISPNFLTAKVYEGFLQGILIERSSHAGATREFSFGLDQAATRSNLERTHASGPWQVFGKEILKKSDLLLTKLEHYPDSVRLEAWKFMMAETENAWVNNILRNPTLHQMFNLVGSAYDIYKFHDKFNGFLQKAAKGEYRYDKVQYAVDIADCIWELLLINPFLKASYELGYALGTALQKDVLIPAVLSAFKREALDALDDAYSYLLKELGPGSDDSSFSGSSKDEFAIGTAGKDRFNGGGGDDTMLMSSGTSSSPGRKATADGNDVFNGGSGSDTIVVTTKHSVSLDLQTGRAAGTTIGRDVVRAVENAVGGVGGDTLKGSNLANEIDGSAGADVIWGRAGNDRLIGGLGNDVLTGGAGADVLIGARGKDRLAGGFGGDAFLFESALDSVPGTRRDVILDFDDGSGNDVIDLSALRPGLGGLSYVGSSSFTGTYQVRVRNVVGPDVWIEINLRGSKTPELVIELDRTSVSQVDLADFIL